MIQTSTHDTWNAGRNYDQYMGRWSRKIAAGFLDWLSPSPNLDWLEIGCGTGAYTATVLANCAPRSILATDSSTQFVAYARDTLTDPRVRFETADATKLPAKDAAFDVVTSALVLNFIPDRVAALAEMRRTLLPGGLLGLYVWDYPGGGMGFIDAFWKAAAKVDPNAAELDEARRFPFCTSGGLTKTLAEAGIPEAVIEPIEVETVFEDFEKFWHPFTLGTGPAPGYCMSLEADRREQLKAQLAEDLGTDGPVRLIARAWAIKATVADLGNGHDL